MAHYAFLDENNIVVEVIPGKNEGEEGIDWEQWYGNFRGMKCKRTSYNTKMGLYFDIQTGYPSADQTKAFRKNYAGIGYTYDETRDAFIPPRESPDQYLDEDSCTWKYVYPPNIG